MAKRPCATINRAARLSNHATPGRIRPTCAFARRDSPGFETQQCDPHGRFRERSGEDAGCCQPASYRFWVGPGRCQRRRYFDRIGCTDRHTRLHVAGTGRGEKQITAASDIYSLGVIFYQLITGKLPHQKDNNIGTLQAVMAEDPVGPRRLNSRIDRDVEAVCLTCLAKHPDRRYSTCQALGDDLSNYLAGRPIQARRMTRVDRCLRWSVRNPVLALITGLLAVSMCLGASISSFYWWQSERARDALQVEKTRADTKAAEALTQARMARVAVQDLQRAIADEPLILEQGMSSFRRNLLDSASHYFELVAAQRPDDRDVLREHLAMLDQLAGLHSDLGDFSKAIVIWHNVIDMTEQHFSMERRAQDALIPVRNRLTESLSTAARHDEALENAGINIQRLGKQGGGQDATVWVEQMAEALRIRAGAESRQGDNLAAAKTLDEAIQLIMPSGARGREHWPDGRLAARLLQTRCEVALQLREHADIDAYAPTAIDLFEQLAKEKSISRPDYLIAMIALNDLVGTSLAISGRFDEVLGFFEMEGRLNDEIRVLRPEVAANSGRAAHQLHRVVKTLYESGQVGKAQELLRSELPKLLDQRNQHPELELLTEKVMLCYQLLGKTYRHEGHLDAAIRELQKAIDICALAVQDPQVSLVVKNHQGSLYLEMASYLLQQHKFAAAATRCEQALDVLEPLYQLQPVGEIADMLEFAYSLTGNIFNRVDRQSDFLQLTDGLNRWPRLTPSVVKAKCHRIISHAHLSQWDRAGTELARLVDGVGPEQHLLDVMGVCFQCAGMLARDEFSDDAVYQEFVRQGLHLIDRMKDAGQLDDPGVIKRLREHDDFHILRQQQAYIQQFGP